MLLLTCEHAGAEVPEAWRDRFAGAEDLLASHRGWDPGAWPLARRLAEALGAPLLGNHVTRLLVEANRSPGHPAFFSALTRDLSPGERADIVAAHWEPHRQRVRGELDALLEGGGTVAHVGVHSFTPVLDGHERTADVGLLYDPSRAGERALCARWKAGLAAARPGLRVRRNYPYRGVSDGLTTSLRRILPAARYLGVELEVNQGALEDANESESLAAALATSLGRALEAS